VLHWVIVKATGKLANRAGFGVARQSIVDGINRTQVLKLRWSKHSTPSKAINPGKYAFISRLRMFSHILLPEIIGVFFAKNKSYFDCFSTRVSPSSWVSAERTVAELSNQNASATAPSDTTISSSEPTQNSRTIPMPLLLTHSALSLQVSLPWSAEIVSASNSDLPFPISASSHPPSTIVAPPLDGSRPWTTFTLADVDVIVG
jgi:hypothetical protein